MRKWCVALAFLAPLSGFCEVPAQIDFARDVQPVFKEHCYSCHGPEQQMANFRLDRRREAMRGGTIVVIAPGTSSGSRLFHKITSTKYGTQMPPTGKLSVEKVEIIKRWLDQGASWPDEVSGDRPQRPRDADAERLMAALRAGDTVTVEKMLKAGSKGLNGRGRGGATPLMYAALYSDIATVKALLQAGADVHAANDAGATALMWSVEDVGKTKLLLDAGADIDAQSSDGRTALSIAAARMGSAGVVKTLLARGAKSTGKPQPPFSDAFLGDPESLDLVLGLQGQSAGLAIALRKQCSACIESLLKFAKPGELAGPLIMAAFMGDGVQFHRLLGLGAPIPPPDDEGVTILMRASAGEHASPKIVQTLLDRGVALNAKTTSGMTALDYARRNGDTPMVEALKKAGGEMNTRSNRPATPPKPAASVKEALDRSLPLLKRADDGFLQHAGCVSCHNNSLFAMTAAAARRSSLHSLDAEPARHRKAIGPYLETWRERAIQGVGIPGGSDTVSYILIGLESVEYPADEATDALAYYLLGRQSADGRWAVQTERPPMESSDIEVTATSLRAIAAYAPKAQKAKYDRAVRQAAAWLETAQPQSTEDRAFHLLGLAWAGANREVRLKAGRALLAEQREDGGWSQLRTLASDAYATGQVLVALREAGALEVSSPQYQKGVRFLLNTQYADGSWFVASRSMAFQPYFESGFPYGGDQWISAAASNWAAMALIGALQ